MVAGLEKMNSKQKEYCSRLSALIDRDRDKKGSHWEFDRSVGNLNGYLNSMEHMGIITNFEKEILSFWFFTGNREDGAKGNE